MSSLKEKYASPEYWTQLIQILLYNKIQDYLDSHNMTKKEFAEKLGVSKGYVSQILNGDFDHKLSKLSELALACDLVPKIEFVPIKYAQEVVKDSYLKPIEWNCYDDFSHKESISVNTIYELPVFLTVCNAKEPVVESLKNYKEYRGEENSNYRIIA